MHHLRHTCAALLAFALVAACSPNDASSGDSTAAAPASSEAVDRPLACTLVTAAEMSAIIGSAVVAVPDDSSGGKTGCTYQPPAGPGSTVKLAVDWSGGEAVMTTMAAMGRKILPGTDDPYAGIGDEVALAGTTLMIRTGEHLVSLDMTDIEEPAPKARRIFDAVKPRM